MLGRLDLVADPVDPAEAANRHYVDQAAASALATAPWTTLGAAGVFADTDAMIIGRAGGSLVQAPMPDFATHISPYLITAMGLTGASAYGLAIYSVALSTDGLTATINGRTLDNGLHAGVQFSFDGSVWQTPAPGDITLTPSGTGDSFALVMRGLSGAYWSIYVRLVANFPTVAKTDYFPIGTASTIGFPTFSTVPAGNSFTMFGFMGMASGFVEAMFPAISSRLVIAYQGVTIGHGNKWYGNTPIQAPARGGNYIVRVINSAEAFDSFHYPPFETTLTVAAPLIPTLWMEPPPPNATFSGGPYSMAGQWGFSQPPSIQYRINGGAHNIDSGWITPASLTINADGTIASVLPKYDTTTSFVIPADNGYTGIQYRRGDNTAIVTHLYAMLP
jgi:hypothetical protein